MKSMTLETLENRQLLAGMHDIEGKLLLTGAFFLTSMLVEKTEAFEFLNNCAAPENVEKCANFCGNPQFTEACKQQGLGADGKPLNPDQPVAPKCGGCPFKAAQEYMGSFF